MAGNIVKWWRHKILGGYKQFSVLPECPTDTEELIYPNRAPSSCSAPPDLLPTNHDREPLTTRGHNHHHHNHHHHSNNNNNNNHQHHTTTSLVQDDKKNKIIDTTKEKKLNKIQDPDRVHLEEFTCDVSVEGGKTPQPLQFSFTLYDLDGHGKITKDDIAGIVSTIYESIGKSVVVPHYGSKTINVRLTVSPDSKKLKSHTKKSTVITPRRRLRPRKLATDDDDDCSDTSNDDIQRRRIQHQINSVIHNVKPSKLTKNSTIPMTTTTATAAIGVTNGTTTANLIGNNTAETSKCHHTQQNHNNNNNSLHDETNKVKGINRISKDSSITTTTTTTTDSALNEHFPNHKAINTLFVDNKLLTKNNCINDENLYESVHNLKFCPKDNNLHVEFASDVGGGCTTTTTQGTVISQSQSQQPLLTGTALTTTTSAIIKKPYCPIQAKVINDFCQLQIKENHIQIKNNNHETTNHIVNNNETCRDCTTLEQQQCSLDVIAHKNGRKKLVRKSRSKKQKTHDDKPISRVRSLSVGNENCWNRVDGIEEDCWKSSLRRHDLIEIIRESMEKNRLCFQANRKPTESPSRHRHRSHTISKMIDDYHISSNNTKNNNEHHQLMPETNLCGYDSFLHATICNNMQQHATICTNTNNNLHFTSSPGVTPQRNFHIGKSSKNRTKTTDISRGNIYSRLQPSSSVKLNTTLLNQLNPNLSAEQKFSRTMNHVEKWLTDRSDNNKTVQIKNNNDNELNEKQIKIIRGTRLKLQRSKSKEEILIKDKNKIDNNLLKTDLLMDKINLSSDIAVDTPKKIFNKEILIAPTTTTNSSSSPKKSPKSRQSKSTPEHLKTKGFIMEYASIPVNADPGECENLLRSGSGVGGGVCINSDEDTANAPSTVHQHRYVHEHIHHHYHHFENDEALI